MRHVTSPLSDPIERAHLRDESGSTPVIHRYEPGSTARSSVRRYWIPVWSFPEGVVSRQRVLQYPVCLVVVTPAYARLVGPTRGLGVTELTGTAWAFGVMLRPSAGWHVVGGDVASDAGVCRWEIGQRGGRHGRRSVRDQARSRT